MSRTRASAKQAGTRWESAIVAWLIDNGWPHAERRRLSGRYDKGDIAGVVEDGFVVMDGATFTALLKEAGYQ